MKNLKVNFFMNILLTLSSIIFPLITFPYISRILLADGVGKVSFATSIVTYFAIFAQLGIPTYGIRACAKVRDNKQLLTKTVHELVIINLIMSVLSYFVFLYFYFNIDRINNEGLLFLIISSTIFFNLIGMEWLYKSLEQYTYITIRSVIFKFIAILLMLIFVKDIDDYIIYGVITIFASSASNILNFINVRKYIDFKFNVREYDLKKHIKPVLIFFALSCATTVYTNLDNVILGFLTDNATVGYYNTAVKIKSLLLSIVTSLGVVLLPRLSYYVEKKREDDFIHLTKKSFNFILLTSLALTIYFIIYAKEGIYLLAGENFIPSILAMKIIMPTVIFIGLTNLFGIQILVPLGKERVVLFSVIVGAVINLILNFILIPIYAHIGAAISNLIAELFVLLVQSYYLKDILKKILPNIKFFVIVISAIFAAFISFIIKLYSFSAFLSLMLSSILFFMTYILMLKVFKENLYIEIESQLMMILKKKIKK